MQSIARTLTERQQSVMERIDRRVPIKVIASELGVSETRINQHIRALKDIYQAGSLNELVELYRAGRGEDGEASENTPYRKPEYSKKQLPGSLSIGEKRFQDDLLNRSTGSQIAPASLLAMPEVEQEEPQVVPGVLDGNHAVLFRLAAIVGIAFGILAAVVLAVTAALALSEAMDGRMYVPVEN